MDTQAALAQLPAKSVRRILRTLLDLRQQALAGAEIEVPLATVYLRSGHTLSGWLIDMGTDESVEAAVFQQIDIQSRAPSTDVFYVDVASIEAVSLVTVEGVLGPLSFGRLPAGFGKPPVSRLSVGRKAEQQSKTLSEAIGHTIAFEIVWAGIAENPDRLNRVAESLQQAGAALRSVTRDAVGKEAIRKLQKIRWEWSATPGADWADSSTVAIRLAEKAPLAADIETAISKGLA